MLVVFRHGAYRFHFYSDEGSPREPVHIHVRRGIDNAKFWLSPEARLAYNFGFNGRELAELHRLIELRAREIEDKWNEHFA